jgi:hypothetical protein
MKTLGSAAALAALAVVVCATSGALAAGSSEAQCNAKNGRYLFWPHGHPVVPSAGFPAFPTPHLELYEGTSGGFPNSAQDAYIDSTGAAGVAKKCRKTAAGFINARVNHSAKTTSTKQIVCKFPARVSYRFGGSKSKGSHLQTVLSGAAVVVEVKMGPSGSSITFDKRYCSAKAPPH